MPEFTEEQLNAVSEELFERLATAQPEANTEISQVEATVIDTPVTELTPEAKDEIQSEAAKSLAKAEHDPVVPPQMTRQVWKQMMRIHFTVRRGLAQPCGHKLATIMVPDAKGKSNVFITSDPRKNCDSCWYTYFNTNGQMTAIADECFREAGRDVLERSRGARFVKYFLRFMSTLARFQREAAEKAAANGVEIESSGNDECGGGSPSANTSVGGVAGETQNIGGVSEDGNIGDGSQGSVDEGPIEGLGVGVSSVRQGLGDEAQPDSAGE